MIAPSGRSRWRQKTANSLFARVLAKKFRGCGLCAGGDDQGHSRQGAPVAGSTAWSQCVEPGTPPQPGRPCWWEMGTTLLTLGDTQAALGAAQQAHDILQALLGQQPDSYGFAGATCRCHDKVGDVLVAQGNLPEALKSYRRASPSASGWRRPIPATRAGSAICRCRTTRSATCWWRRATCRRR